MDSSGKIIWAKHNEIQTVNVKSVPSDFEVTDGERLPLAVKELGSCDLYPQSLLHNPNGRFVVVCGDGEYIIYTALAWRNRSFGAALEFAWSTDGEYAVKESTSKIKIFNKNFQERKSIRPTFSAEGIHGGALLAVRSNEFVCFYDWAECRVVRRIDVAVKDIFWSDNGDLIVIASESSFYILKFNRSVVASYLEGAAADDQQGVEEAFELLHEVSESIKTGVWVGDCFIYNNSSSRLNYCVGGEVTTMYHLDRPMYLLGYLAAQSRIYLIDKEFNVISYTLLLSLIEYKTLVLRGDLEGAEGVLPSIPGDQLNSVARFLEARGHVEDALRVATDPDYKFDLAVQLGRLEIAEEIALKAQSENKWKQLGDLALSAGKLDLAQQCLHQAGDLSGILLLCSAQGNAEGLKELAERAKADGKFNVAFVCLFLLGKADECIQLLCDSGRIPEAAFLARTYAPSKVSEVVDLWRNDLKKINAKAAESLADPFEYPNLFPNWQLALKAEEHQKAQREIEIDGKEYPAYKGSTNLDLIESVRTEGENEEVATEEFVEDEGATDEGIADEPSAAEIVGQDGEVVDETTAPSGAESAPRVEGLDEIDDDWGEDEV